MKELKSRLFIKYGARSIFIVCGLSLVYFVTLKISENTDIGKLGDLWSEFTLMGLLLATFGYQMSHFIRSFRLAVLLNDENVSIRKLIYIQFLGNGVNLVLPFRLGEFYRVYLLAALSKDTVKSFFIVVVERLLDFSVIFLLFITIQIFVDIDLAVVKHLTVVAISFFILVFLLLVVLRENIGSTIDFLVRRYTSRKVITLIRLLNITNESIDRIRAVVSNKSVTIFMLTCLIWMFEVLVFLLFFDQLGGEYSTMLTLAVMVFLASLLPSGPIGYGGVQLAFLLISGMIGDSNFVALSLAYNVIIFLPACLVALILYFFSKKVLYE
jgi:hypothetical protein